MEEDHHVTKFCVSRVCTFLSIPNHANFDLENLLLKCHSLISCFPFYPQDDDLV